MPCPKCGCPDSDWLLDRLLWVFAEALRPILFLRRPGSPRAYLFSQEAPDVLRYAIQFPPVAPDSIGVTKRRLTTVRADGTVTAEEFDPGASFEVTLPGGSTATANAFVLVTDGEKVTLTLFDLDQAGNVSPPSPPFELTGADTIPPAAPGAVNPLLVGEEA